MTFVGLKLISRISPLIVLYMNRSLWPTFKEHRVWVTFQNAEHLVHTLPTERHPLDVCCSIWSIQISLAALVILIWASFQKNVWQNMQVDCFLARRCRTDNGHCHIFVDLHWFRLPRFIKINPEISLLDITLMLASRFASKSSLFNGALFVWPNVFAFRWMISISSLFDRKF